MKKPLLTIFAFTAIALSACKKDHPVNVVAEYPNMAEAADPKLLMTTPDGVKVYNGGFGSAIAADHKDPNVFYLLTDRGPNAAGAVTDAIIFGKADFTPEIGKFRLKDGKLVLEQTIELKNASGQKLNGLPNPAGEGATGEIAFDLSGKQIAPSIDGIDSEGMVLAADGSFWISDEYGPHIVHFDASGKTLERINPFGTGTGGRKIPLVFAKRKPNRGMEGLTITPDGKTLIGMMQSPMLNPTKAAASNSTILRILTFDIQSGATKQYAYVMDNVTLTGVSDIVAVNSTTFLTIERDGLYGGAPTNPATFKKVFKINIDGATDISDAANSATGKLYGGKTVEELNDNAGLQTAGITPVSKTLVLDLLKDLPTVYPHDKAEGLALLPGNILAISNDDDFGVLDNGKGGFNPKILPATNSVDHNRVYFVKIKL
ncbi:esterase-like activity of phytase family protein [Mucilaginibacter sabulilitoris]|uniref:Esterase-like activity of phytase family protein n=1 Tax=Mucilaginibacter sabulilitoris TaxID=1173583 RepID=A0ABZ0TV30_9SPHI|nr:esterase-like activity of phytase family protein [Mucilaginibacter sabulilitoris]WPU96322.1 esterase-like activity of phytase family protein [Mucilaginibacter sabulilitoris]